MLPYLPAKLQFVALLSKADMHIPKLTARLRMWSRACFYASGSVTRSKKAVTRRAPPGVQV